MQRINWAVEGLDSTISNYEVANAQLIEIINSTVQELLHDVIAKNVNSVLSSSDDISKLLSRFSESDKAAVLAGDLSKLASALSGDAPT